MDRLSTWLVVGILYLPTSPLLVGQSNLNNYEFTPEAIQTYHQIINLEFDGAAKTIQKNKSSNLVFLFLEDYVDFLKIFINQESDRIDFLLPGKASRLHQIEANGNKNSPYHRYIMAEIYLHWSLIYIQEASYWKGYIQARKAYNLLSENQRLFPDFIPTYKSLGLLHAAVGSVPDPYKGLFAFFSGMKGSIDQGKSEIQIVLNHINENPDYIFKEETVVLYALLLLHLDNEANEAWKIIKDVDLDSYQSPLIIFSKANIAMHTGRNEEALDLILNFNSSSDAWPFHYLEFIKGLALIRKLDFGCIQFFQNYIQKMPQKNYVRESYQKLAWSALLANETQGYRDYLAQAKVQGLARVDGDKNAIKESKEMSRGKFPNVILLRARLLCDGGYFERALELLTNERQALITDSKNQTEYYYRVGRIYHDTDRLPEALNHYQKTIEIGRQSPEYFACNAALQMGLIYESQEDYGKAKKYFDLCLEIYPDNYRQSLHLKARAGLNRIR